MDPLHVAGLVQAGLGLVLVLLGRWGMTMGDRLVPHWRTEEDREHHAAVNRRGSLACLGAGCLLIVAAAATLLVG